MGPGGIPKRLGIAGPRPKPLWRVFRAFGAARDPKITGLLHKIQWFIYKLAISNAQTSRHIRAKAFVGTISALVQMQLGNC
jgi:hypothetical protein